MPTPLCTSCTRRSLSPCPNLNLIHYIYTNIAMECRRLADTFKCNEIVYF
ncbi:cation-transporting ATPase [Kingella kingae]|nr:cation-transporting ATPase [Kingella kingae]MDK4539317.1 cation-transporting ATPase [Kingella kingae]